MDFNPFLTYRTLKLLTIYVLLLQGQNCNDNLYYSYVFDICKTNNNYIIISWITFHFEWTFYWPMNVFQRIIMSRNGYTPNT